MFDVVVIGSGPAGSSSAIRLRQRGYTVLLIDRAKFPRDKACGEGILPRGVEAIAQLGLTSQFRALEPARIRGLDFVVGRHRARGDLIGEGAGVERTQFDAMLVNAAIDAGAQWTCGEPVRFDRDERERVRRVVLRDGRAFEAAVFIGADGLRSWTRRTAEIGVASVGERHGLCTRVAVDRDVGDRVTVNVMPGKGELYIGPTGPRQLSITWLTSQSVLRRDRGDAPSRLRRCVEASGMREIEGATWIDTVRSSGPFPVRARAAGRDGVLLVGDAFESIDPIGGDGITLALMGSAPGADAVGKILSGANEEEAIHDYAEALKGEHRRRRAFAGVLGLAAKHRHAAAGVVRVLEALPSMMSKLCAWHEHGLSDVEAMGTIVASR